MSELDPETLAGGEKSPPVKRPKMVNVYNAHHFKSFHLGGNRKIGPGQQGKIPYAVYRRVKDQCSWLKKAERGDVV